MGLLTGHSVPQLVIAALNATVGALLILRGPLLSLGSARAVLASLPGVVIAGVVLKMGPALELWPWSAQALFSAGGTLAIAAFLSLGRSFAILPALRAIVSRGPFRVIRHPAYAGELLMVLACLVAGPAWTTAVVIAFAIPLVILRIHVEERVLMEEPGYVEYSRRVRARLVPLIW